MNAPPDLRLQRLLGGNARASLRRRLRRHFERAGPDGTARVLRISGLTAEEHAALAALTGRPTRYTRSMQLDLDAVDRALAEAGIAASVLRALEALDGPIVRAAEARAALQARWSATAGAARHPQLSALLDAPAGLGLLKRLAAGDPAAGARLCAQADAVLAALPAPPQTRARLAAATLGDPHALDGGRPVATLVLAALRRALALARPAIEMAGDAAVDSEDEASESEDTRAVWARAGVLVNELARPALFLNLPVIGDEAPAARAGQPHYASLRGLVRAAPVWDVAGRTVFVCENPSVVAIAADVLGAACAPLACTEGMPAAAQRTLLTQLARAGARLRYHGDFDWPGLRIGNHVMAAHGAVPWRFGAADYVAAVRDSPRPGLALAAPEADAAWDPALRPAMQAQGMAIAEESVIDGLIADLGGARSG